MPKNIGNIIVDFAAVAWRSVIKVLDRIPPSDILGKVLLNAILAIVNRAEVCIKT